MRLPCLNGCIKCGFCCVALTIDDEKLKKPAFSVCQNLRYQAAEAICSIHGENKPATCMNYDPVKRFRLLWFDERLRFYKQTGYVKHLKWMANNSFMDHLPVFKDIAARDYGATNKVYRYFIYPYLFGGPDVEAAKDDWLNSWPGLISYLDYMPSSVKEILVAVASARIKKAKSVSGFTIERFEKLKKGELDV
jgi:hypothetical protein